MCYAQIICKLTDVHRQVQALAIEKPKEDDVTVLVRMSNCSISRTGLVSRKPHLDDSETQ